MVQSLIKKILKEELLNEVRVPREERVQLYKDKNIIVIVPLSHRALQKYANRCQWCINDDKYEWEDYHLGKHAIIIQRNPKPQRKGATGIETAGEIFILGRLDSGNWTFGDANSVLNGYFNSKEEALDYYVGISNNLNNFALNTIYYSPENGIYDMEDNSLWNYNIEISDIPNVTQEVVDIMNDYLLKEEIDV